MAPRALGSTIMAALDAIADWPVAAAAAAPAHMPAITVASFGTGLADPEAIPGSAM